ncbi:MAG: hypothetical protein U0V02_22690 [Anaerolineales bacterium]
MLKKSKILLSVLALLVVAIACANPLGGASPAEPANVETIVAATFAALTTVPATESGATPPPATESLLPASLYFLNADSASHNQVYRLAMDGVTVTQLTFEPASVEQYDVSQVDGSIAYTSNNQLFTVNRDGSNRSMVVDGGVLDPNSPATTLLSNPLWSPDAQTIAFGHKGVNLYSVVAGQSTLVLPSKIDSEGFGQAYWPESYSPDGTKLLVTVAPVASDGSFSVIYHPSDNTVVELKNPSGGAGSTCCSFSWSADSASIYTGTAFLSPFTSAGMSRVDTNTGKMEALLTSDEVAENFNLATAPFLAPDGHLYFIYANQSGLNNFSVNVALQMVRSAPDGVTGRTVLRPESFSNASGFLWAPDASFLIATTYPAPDVYAGGPAQLYYSDGRPSLSLVPFAMEMKWGP